MSITLSIYSQNTLFIIGCLVAAVTFSFTDIILFEGNEVGAKVFYMISTAALYIVLPGMRLCLCFCIPEFNPLKNRLSTVLSATNFACLWAKAFNNNLWLDFLNRGIISSVPQQFPPLSSFSLDCLKCNSHTIYTVCI